MIDLIYPIGGLLICVCLGYVKGRLDGEDFYEKKAIDAGAAIWTIDPKTGDKEFQFISPEQPLSGTGRG